jgi:hypothetical protein
MSPLRSASRGRLVDMTLRPRRWSRVIGLVALVAGISVPCVDASTSVGVLKATFLYNFAKFTEWPTDVLAPGQRLLLCVVGDADVAEALEQTIKGRMLDGHTLEVQVVTLDALPTFPCHVLYISSNDLKRSAARLAALRTVPTLTVSDGDKFAQHGGIAQLVTEHDHMRFAINPMAAARARLRLSSKLLSLAELMKEKA